MNNKNYIVYQITNKINEKIYIGCHVTENVDDNYMGSGTNIKKAISEFGRENFDKIVLYNFSNKDDMLEKEKQLVNKKFIKKEDNYNIIIGGSQYLSTDTITVKNKKGEFLQVHKDDPRYLSGELVGATKGRITVKDKDGNYYSVYNDDPKYLSGELVYASKGMINVRDENGNFFQVSSEDSRFFNGKLVGVFSGKKHKEKSKKKIGEKNAIHQKGKGNSQYGTCWITNEINSKKIKKGDEIPNGWRLGRKINK